MGGLSQGARENARFFDVQFAHAFDVNNLCGFVYKENFPEATVHRRSIEHLKLRDFERLQCDVWLMSPPCQPFTSSGKKLCEQDSRNAALTNITNILEKLEGLPWCIFLENVPNFSESNPRGKLVQVLQSRGFEVKEFIISPTQIGCPNSRSRYYLTAWLQSEGTRNLDSEATTEQISKPMPQICGELPEISLVAFNYPTNNVPTKCLGEYLEYYEDLNLGLKDLHDSNVCAKLATSCRKYTLQELLIPKERTRNLAGLKFDIAHEKSTITTTFTGGYGKLVAKSGPVLLLSRIEKVRDCENRSAQELADERFATIDPNEQSLRNFSPSEILRIHGFPSEFKLPPTIGIRKLWHLLGNSVQ
eukprot:Gregarina_sp_Poly_1__7374@NODE_407_length_8828_cov_117_859034_g331_i0_p2_GENE_NODE_407_length_8828_cov_117_859034_g331_i0NODE_407_length_8828_cov_117_859034_g331_i0_p2_ORF_typecomplete_len361_score33_71DNA_methylase/PF00145_17/5_4e40_NODE_407_length_8828_cov_117_859034_g331_i014382520